MEFSDEELVRLHIGGHRTAFRQLVERYAPSIYGLALSMTGDRMEAEDLSQETFLRVYTALPGSRLDLPFALFLLALLPRASSLDALITIHMLLVGWGEGLEQAADYLNQKEASQLKVATWYEQVFNRRLHPAVIDKYHGQKEPEYVVRLKGVDYALIYHAP